MKKVILALILGCMFITACKKKKEEKPDTPISANSPNLIIKLRFDSTQVRLDNFGNPTAIPTGNSAQSPIYYGLSTHFIELLANSSVLPGQGTKLFKGIETTEGGTNAADFSQAIIKGNNEVFFSIPISEIKPDTYNYLRSSVTYQNYDINYYVGSTSYVGRMSSFVGWNTYLTSYMIKNQTVTVNGNKLQGYFGFETSSGNTIEGQTPPGATTVPNPIATSSPIPAGSCLVTGQFSNPFTITGNETQDITIIISLSTNKSFEWKDNNHNGLFEPLTGDTVVNMGLRGLIPIVQ